MYYPGSLFESSVISQIPYSSFIGANPPLSDQVPTLSSSSSSGTLCHPAAQPCLSDKKMISAQNATVLPLPVVNPFHLSSFCPPPPASHNPYNVGQSGSKESTTLITSSSSTTASSSSSSSYGPNVVGHLSIENYEQTSIMDSSPYGVGHSPHHPHPQSHPHPHHHPFTAYPAHYYLNTVPQPNPPPPPSSTVLNGGFTITNGLSTSPYPNTSVNNGFFRPSHPSNGSYLHGAPPPPPPHHQVHHHHASTIYNESYTIPDYINRQMVDVASKTLYPATPVTVASVVATTSIGRNDGNEHNSFSDHLKRLQESFQSKSHNAINNNNNNNKCNDCSSAGSDQNPNVPENGHYFPSPPPPVHHHHLHHTNAENNKQRGNSSRIESSEMDRNSIRIKDQTFPNGDLSNDASGGGGKETKSNDISNKSKFSQVWNPLIGKSNTNTSDNHRSSILETNQHEKIWNASLCPQSKFNSASSKGGRKNPTKNEIIKKSNSNTVKKDKNHKRKLHVANDGNDRDQDQDQDEMKQPPKAKKSKKKKSLVSKNCDKLVSGNNIQSQQKNSDSQMSFNHNTSTFVDDEMDDDGGGGSEHIKRDKVNDDDDDNDDEDRIIENGSSWISVENGDYDNEHGDYKKSIEPKECLNESVLPDDDGDDDKTTTIKDVKLIKKSANYARRRRFRSGLDMIRNFRKKPPKTKSTPNKDLNHRSGDEKKTTTKKKKDSIDSKDLKRLMVNKSLGETLLHRSARNNRLDVIRQCLESEACDVNAKDNAGYTPLHECSSRGHLEVARILLQHGADVNASAIGGIRPLHDAIECNHIETVRLLLSYGADPLISTYSGTTPLQLCRSKLMKKFLEGFYQDIGTDLTTIDDANVWLFKFYSSNLDKETGFDVFGDLSDIDDSDVDSDESHNKIDLIFQISTKPFLNLYTFLQKSNQSPFYLLNDVIKSLNITRENFIHKHPQIKIMTINRKDYLKNVIPVQLEARISHQNIINSIKAKNVKNNSKNKKSNKILTDLDRSRPSNDPPQSSTTDEIIEIIYEDERILRILDIETTVIPD